MILEDFRIVVSSHVKLASDWSIFRGVDLWLTANFKYTWTLLFSPSSPEGNWDLSLRDNSNYSVLLDG